MVELFLSISYFFGIDKSILLKRDNKILDCPSGASSFVAEANLLRAKVTGCDPLYNNSYINLLKKGLEDIQYVIGKVKLSSQLYNWDFYKSVECLRQSRILALLGFISDYSKESLREEKRYVKAALPKLPFDSKSFDLVLSGHFLFTYANKFDVEFHLSSILEMIRVSRNEVRIYPLQQGMISQPYIQTDELLTCLKKEHIRYEIITVPFEFQNGSNKMLRLIH